MVNWIKYNWTQEQQETIRRGTMIKTFAGEVLMIGDAPKVLGYWICIEESTIEYFSNDYVQAIEEILLKAKF